MTERFNLAVWHPILTGAAWLAVAYALYRVVRWWTRETWREFWT